MARERELHAGPVNVEYLKHAVYGYIIASTDKEKLTLLSVISTMLHFTPEEIARAKSIHASGGILGLIWGGGGGAGGAVALGDPPGH